MSSIEMCAIHISIVILELLSREMRVFHFVGLS